MDSFLRITLGDLIWIAFIVLAVLLLLIVWVGERVKRLWRRVFPVVAAPKREDSVMTDAERDQFGKQAKERASRVSTNRCPHKFWDGDRCCGCGIERDGVKAAIIQRRREGKK